MWQRLHQPAKTGEGGQHPRKGREAFHAATGGVHTPIGDCSFTRWMHHDESAKAGASE
jgi:hypothetical protein